MIYSKAIEKYLNSVLDSGQNGLYLLAPPTGAGKTYLTVKAIKRFVEKNPGKRVIFATPLKKNLPSENLEKEFGTKKYKKHVLMLNANKDNVEAKLKDKKIREQMKRSAEIMGLSSQFAQLCAAFNPEVAKKLSLDELSTEKYRRDAEYSFRSGLKKYLTAKYPDSDSRLQAIENTRDTSLNWVAEVYPAVFIGHRPILLMSMDKFLYQVDTIIGEVEKFTDPKNLENTVIVLDEFDETKAVIQKVILENGVANIKDCKSLFELIYQEINPARFSSAMKNVIDDNASLRTSLKEIMKMGDQIHEKFHTHLHFKLKDDQRTSDRYFLMNTGTTQQLSGAQGKGYLGALHESDPNQVTLELMSREDYEKQKDDEAFVNTISLLYKSHTYFGLVSRFIREAAEEYKNVVNHGKRDEDTAMTVSQSISSVLYEIGHHMEGDPLQDDPLYKLVNDSPVISYTRPKLYKNRDSVLDDYSFYNKGMQLYSLHDSMYHNEDTFIQYMDIRQTPEALLVNLCQNAPVLGISASGEMKSVTGNYNLKYIQSRIGDGYHETPADLMEIMKSVPSMDTQLYRQKGVCIHTNVMESYNKDDYTDSPTEESLQRLVRRKLPGMSDELHAFTVNTIQLLAARRSMEGDEVVKNLGFYTWRILTIIQLLADFTQYDDLRSFLFLGQGNRSEQEMEMLENIYGRICSEKGKTPGRLFLLDSKGFDTKKKDILKYLKKGKKAFVFSSYNSIGAGQNINYPIPPDLKDEVIYLVDENSKDSRTLTKDFDGFFFEQVHYLAPVTSSNVKMSFDELMKTIIISQELYEGAEFSYSQVRNSINRGITHHVSLSNRRRGDFVDSDIRESRSKNWERLKIVYQAFGRGNRTFVKNKNIRIYMESKLLTEIDGDLLRQTCIVQPELEAMLAHKHEKQKKQWDEMQYANNEGERISCQGKFVINDLLDALFSDVLEAEQKKPYIDCWKEIREMVLKNPVRDAVDPGNRIQAQFYIQQPLLGNSYPCIQANDFSRVTIGLGQDMSAFKSQGHIKEKLKEGGWTAMMVCEENSRLPEVLQYPGMRAHFLEKGYAVSFDTGRYILSPAAYNNIYKGAVGEAAGAFILEKELGLHLTLLEDPNVFEVFDFQIEGFPGVFIDFKNWSGQYRVQNAVYQAKIDEKIAQTQASLAVFINVVGSASYECCERVSGNVIEIPGLMDAQGNVLHKNIKYLKEKLYAIHNPV